MTIITVDADLLLVSSDSHDPWYNLALEDILVDGMDDAIRDGRRLSGILYLWQNQDTVVIGRNQNAWAECNTALLESENGHLARRTTGGGAVYHDLGNLNFSLILPRRNFSLDKNFDMIVAAVASQGISAVRSGRNDVLADGRKFSGNAFSHRGEAALHHGTLLIHSDYKRVSRYLTVRPEKLQAKGVTSVRSRIINLIDLSADASVAGLSAAMEAAFLSHFTAVPRQSNRVLTLNNLDFTSNDRLAKRRAFFASWDWRYGQTLRFDAALSKQLEWGIVDIGLVIENGLVLNASIYSDALDGDFIDRMARQLTGCRFHADELARAIAATPGQDNGFGPSRRQMAQDMADLLLEQGW